MPHVPVNGVRLYYEEHGSGAPILGIHGAGSSAVFWEGAARTLSQLGRVIIYDRRGSSRSERPEPYDTTTVQQHADDARELLRALDAEPALLIGRSFGGTVALDLALRNPESVRALALLEAGPMGLSREYDEWFLALAATLEQVVADRGTDAVGETVIREVLGAWEELPDSVRTIFTANSAAFLAEIRGGERLTDVSGLGALRIPTLIVGAEDSAEPIQHGTAGLVQALPQAHVVRVGGGHVIDPAGPDVLAFASEHLHSPNVDSGP
jgi:pimeloyl-ACP methyl ester carboxylesterase